MNPLTTGDKVRNWSLPLIGQPHLKRVRGTGSVKAWRVPISHESRHLVFAHACPIFMRHLY